MAVIKWDPLRELEEMADRLNRVMSRPEGGTPIGSGKEAMTVADWIPTVDITETEADTPSRPNFQG